MLLQESQMCAKKCNSLLHLQSECHWMCHSAKENIKPFAPIFSKEMWTVRTVVQKGLSPSQGPTWKPGKKRSALNLASRVQAALPGHPLQVSGQGRSFQVLLV